MELLVRGLRINRMGIAADPIDELLSGLGRR